MSGIEAGYIGNAAGVLDTTKFELENLARSQANFIVTKSMTIEPRKGNPEPRLKTWGFSSTNSNGLANLGVDAYCVIIPEIESKYDTIVVPSISTSDNVELSVIDQYKLMVSKLEAIGVKRIQFNTSCPNLPGKPMIGNSPETLDDMFKEARPSNIPFSVKVQPYNTDPILFKQVVETMLKYKPAEIVAINSIPLSMFIDTSTMRKTLRPNNGWGGYGGAGILPIATGEVNRWYREIQRRELPTKVIGCGGVYDLDSALQHHMAGAYALEIGTWFLQEGTGVFAQLKRARDAWLADRGYDISDIIGIAERNPEVSEIVT